MGQSVEDLIAQREAARKKVLNVARKAGAPVSPTASMTNSEKTVYFMNNEAARKQAMRDILAKRPAKPPILSKKERQ